MLCKNGLNIGRFVSIYCPIQLKGTVHPETKVLSFSYPQSGLFHNVCDITTHAFKETCRPQSQTNGDLSADSTE